MAAVPKKKHMKENAVYTHFWTSGMNPKVPGENVGHVSVYIKFQDKYMSLWPEGSPHENKLRATLERRDPHYMGSFDDDLAAEERQPEVTYCLYGLDIDKISKKFDELSAQNPKWTLLGRTLLVPRDNAHSCATFAYELLKAGGIYEIITSARSGSYSSVVAPDTLLPAVKAAKKSEIQNYKETITYDTQSDIKVTQIDIPKEEQSEGNTSCLIL